jgi:hypothetical protein
MGMGDDGVNIEIEQIVISRTGHQFRCWEYFAEVILEEHPEVQADGGLDDMIDGLTIFEHFTQRVLLVDDSPDCNCDPNPDRRES